VQYFGVPRVQERRFRGVLNRALIAPALVVVALGVVLLLQVSTLVETMRNLRHADAVMDTSTNVLRLMVDQETGLRGYLLTGDHDFLDIYHASQAARRDWFTQMQQMLKNQPDQLARNSALDAKYQQWQELAEGMIARKQAGHPVAGIIENSREKALMDEIRLMQGSFTAEATRIRAESERRAQKSTRLVLIGSVALTLLLGLMLAFTTRHQLLRLSRVYGKALTEAQTREEQVRRAKEWFETSLHSIVDAVITTDVQGGILFMNAAAERLTGWPAPEAGGQRLHKLLSILDEDTHRVLEDPVHMVTRSGKMIGGGNHKVLRGRDGRETVIQYTAAPIRDTNSSMVGVVLVFRDMTERRKIEHTLRSSEKLALAGRLTATIAHEINNPLASVSNVLFLMREKAGGDKELLRMVEIASTELARVTLITRSMLSLYREADHPVPVDVKDAVASALALLDKPIREKGIRLKTSFEHGQKIQGYPAELRQVFANLVSNAVEASKPETELTIHSYAAAQNGGDASPGVIVEVCDQGSGIPPEALANIFQPFFTTKGEHGTGLGLWVSQGIVKKHGGRITVQSHVGPGPSGTTFSMFLPLRLEKQSPGPELRKAS
jgi:PAS domain S-box-containing protein